jgi:hypothetical protein
MSNKTDHDKLVPLRRVRLALARDREHPQGSRDHGYDFIAPIDDKGHIDAETWRKTRDRCRVKRYAPGDEDEVGHVVHKPGGAWAFHYDIKGNPDRDETGYRLEQHVFLPGEYVSIKEHDGVLRTFIVQAVVDLD